MNNLIQIAIYISLFLVFIPSIIYFVLHIVFYYKSRKYSETYREENTSEVSLTIVIPVRNEPIEYISKRLEEISSWRINGKVDVLIISMDPYQYYMDLKKIAEKYREHGLNTYVFWRNTIEGYKAKSLNIALWFSNTKYLYVMDVDSVIEPSFIETSIKLMENNPDIVAVVGRWCGLNRDTRIAESVASSMDFLTETIYKGRYASGLSVYPLGTGTIYRRDFLIKLNGWDENRLLDDLEIGCRIVSKGGRVVYLDNFIIGVEVPRKYSSLSIQQERWVYGAFDVLLTRFKHILHSPQSILGKIDMYMYLTQYLPSIALFLGAVLLAIVTFFNKIDVFSKYWFLSIAWLVLLFTYGKCYISALHSRRYSIRRSLINLGRSGVLLVILTPVFLKSFIKRMLGLKMEFKRTPKGVYDKLITRYRLPIEFLIGFSFFIYSIFLLVNRVIYTGLWFLTYSTPYIYALTKWWKDVLVT